MEEKRIDGEWVDMFFMPKNFIRFPPSLLECKDENYEKKSKAHGSFTRQQPFGE